jgi:hypothetical protein
LKLGPILLVAIIADSESALHDVDVDEGGDPIAYAFDKYTAEGWLMNKRARVGGLNHGQITAT